MSDDDNESLFVSEVNPTSERGAVLDDDGTTGWLYLTDRNGRDVVADVWVYNRVTAPASEAIEVSPDRPPPASHGVVDGSELYRDPKQYLWSFDWHRGGDAVVLMRGGEPWAALSAERPRGITRHLTVICAWGEPWQDAWYRQWITESAREDPSGVGPR
jgi:hypothetical protein